MLYKKPDNNCNYDTINQVFVKYISILQLCI